jgi:hypothetical protein
MPGSVSALVVEQLRITQDIMNSEYLEAVKSVVEE